ncbi:transglutaminase-like domain-containing protein [Thermococcus camini]|uniref:Calcium-binding protein n=1 Tax=Thermococcus camini TaxID=2016373 RepID=A0A7G2D3X2_9EURY|nr:transglutaminase-like domain-containing protein [Thermococcus camini]CAD5243189.1 Calcium-binding protein [Thermococcus camini]
MRRVFLASLTCLLLLLSVFSAGCIGGERVNSTRSSGTEVAVDGDGIPDAEEAQYGTDPNLRDSDGDGLDDGVEVNVYNTSPAMEDTDGDGLGDGDEVYIYGTDPRSNDTDGDGLDDGDEVLSYLTDPLSNDTDRDGLPDYNEVLLLNTSPTLADTDGDGLFDPVELSNGTDPRIDDTDGDGLVDGDEVFIYLTDPLVNDTDGDGLLDGAEVLTYRTDPLRGDTDRDYLPDGYEVSIGTDPAFDWRYGFGEETLRAGLSALLRRSVSGLAGNFSSGPVLDRAWAVLGWVGENIAYNHTKAEYVNLSVSLWDSLNETAREMYANLTRVQAINDTAYSLRSGICTDYALLTAGLLLEANVSPVYVLSIDYWNQTIGHATVAIEVNNTYFVLDQRLPPIPLGNYYWYLIYSGMGEIENVTVYRVSLDESGEVVVDNWTWSGDEIGNMAYRMTEDDVKLIESLTEEYLLEKYPAYHRDARLAENVDRYFESIVETGEGADTYLPYGFTEGWYLSWGSGSFSLYYHPLLAEKLVRYYWPGPGFGGGDWEDILKKCDAYYLKIGFTGNGTSIVTHTGDSLTFPELLMVMEVAR